MGYFIWKVLESSVVELNMQLTVLLVKDSSELAATVLQLYASQQSTPATLAPSPLLTEKSVSWIERIQFRWTQQQWQNLVNLNRTILFFGVEFKNLGGAKGWGEWGCL